MRKEILILFLLAAVLLAGCVEEQPRQETIKVGALLPLTGETMVWGENCRSGMELAVEEINAAGGIGGKKLQIIYEDSQCNPAKTVSGIQKLISVDRVQAVIGEICSSATLAAAPIAESDKVVLLSPGAAADNISNAGDFVFRTYPQNEYVAKKVVELLKKFNKNRVAVMYVNNDYGIGLKDNVVKEIPEKIVAAEGHDQKATDFRTTLIKIKEKNIDALFVATYYADGALIVKQAKELNLDALLVGTDGFDDQKAIEIAGNAAEGVIFPTVKPGTGPASAEFTGKYVEKYKKQPPFLSDFGYDAVNVIAEAMKKGYFEGKQIRDFLYNLKQFPGAANTMTFDRNGDLKNPALTIKTIKDGKIVEYEGA